MYLNVKKLKKTEGKVLQLYILLYTYVSPDHTYQLHATGTQTDSSPPARVSEYS